MLIFYTRVLQIDPILKLSELICNQIVVCLIHIENVCFFCFLKGKTLLLKELTVKNWVDWVYIYIYRDIDIASYIASYSNDESH